MIQGSRGSGFLLEAAQMIGIIAGSWTDQFQRDIAAKPFIARAEDISHPA